MIKKVLIFLIALLGCLCSTSAAENEKEYEVIVVQRGKTGECFARDTLFNDGIMRAERRIIRYAESRIPKKFRDTLEKYYVYNTYYLTEKTTESVYRLWYSSFDNGMRWIEFEKLK